MLSHELHILAPILPHNAQSVFGVVIVVLLVVVIEMSPNDGSKEEVVECPEQVKRKETVIYR